MSLRDEPAFPVILGHRHIEGGFVEVESYPGLTKFEHTVIEMAKAMRVGFRENSAESIVASAVLDAERIWDAIEDCGDGDASV